MLTQEVITYLATFIRIEPSLFDPMIRLRLGLIIQVAAREFAREAQVSPEEVPDVFLNLSPFFMKTLIYHIIYGKEFKLVREDDEYTIVSTHSRLSRITFTPPGLEKPHPPPATVSPTPEVVHEDKLGFWFNRRFIDGSLNRVPEAFFANVWRILDCCKGISLCGHILKSEIVSEMTPNETKFALIVECALNSLRDPEYRQLMIEAIMILGALLSVHSFDENKEDIIQLDLVIDQANDLFLENQVFHSYHVFRPKYPVTQPPVVLERREMSGSVQNPTTFAKFSMTARPVESMGR